MNKVIHNTQTGEIIEKPLTAAEIKDIEQIHENYVQSIAAEQAKKTARQSALSKLIDLGLTEEEIAAL